jgi:hypothetical protein
MVLPQELSQTPRRANLALHATEAELAPRAQPATGCLPRLLDSCGRVGGGSVVATDEPIGRATGPDHAVETRTDVGDRCKTGEGC